MKKTKMRSEEPPQDRLSELPDSLIFEIFWFLPMRYFVRTTVLSKRWNNLWKTTPYLNFDRHAPKFVYRTLVSWRGFKILKFKFCGSSVLKKSVFGDIDVWVRLAMDNGVQELYLEDMGNYYLPCEDVYRVPHSLYSCSSLKVLSLKGCSFRNHGNVQWNQLKSLTILGYFLDQNFINKVISGSPQLEVFNLNFEDNAENNLSIRSSRLKKFSIQRNLWFSIVPEVRIWCPNLETLDIVGMPYGKCSLMNVSSLSHLTLDYYEKWRPKDFFGELMGQIFPAIQHVEKLTLSDWWIKGLGTMKEKYLLSPLSNFKFLTINRREVAYEEIMDVLQIFPKLETLVLGYICDTEFENHETSFLQIERNFPESKLLQLRTVDITLNEVDNLVFPFITSLLKQASNLQKMVIREKGLVSWRPSMTWWLALQQNVLRIPRSSPTAELIFA